MGRALVNKTVGTLKKLIQSAPRMRGVTPVPNGPLVKKNGSTLKKGGTVKKAQTGVTEKSKVVYRNPDNTYKTVIKSKKGPGMEQKSVKEVRTFKGLIKGMPKTSGALQKKNEPRQVAEQPKMIAKNGNKLKSKNKK